MLAVPESSGNIRFQQLVQMHDHITHFGIVNRALGAAAPGVFGFGIAAEYADQVHFLKVHKIKRLRIADAPAHYEVEFLHGH